MTKGRGNSNSFSVKEVLRLEINQLKKGKILISDNVIVSKVSWSCGASIQITSNINLNERFIRLKYNYQDKLIEYDVQLTTIKSNLGVGDILYFVCPETKKRCKVLYCCYGSEIFKSRGAYKRRIYYFNQFISKTGLTATRYNQVDKKINDIYSNRLIKFYRGQETKKYKRLKKLIDKRAYLSDLKDRELEEYLEKYMGFSMF